MLEISSFLLLTSALASHSIFSPIHLQMDTLVVSSRVSHLSIPVTKYPRSSIIKKKVYFWLMISECGSLAPHFWAIGEAVQQWRVCSRTKTFDLH